MKLDTRGSAAASTFFLGALLATFILTGGVGVACTTPVFRYALERWEPDRYTVIVAHNEPLDAKQAEWVGQLRDNPALSAYALRAVEGQINLPFALPIKFPGDAPPTLFLYAPPEIALAGPVWSGVLSQENVRCLLKSPARATLFERLMGGHAVVWLAILPGEDKAKDAAFLQRLEQAIQTVNQSLNPPDANSADPPVAEPPVVPFRFSVLPVNRDANGEAVLSALLKALAPKVHDSGEPVAIPVFGRGRALQQIPASELTEDLVREVSLFLTGSCSCQVKRMNPGVDLFLPHNWEEALAQQPEAPKP